MKGFLTQLFNLIKVLRSSSTMVTTLLQLQIECDIFSLSFCPLKLQLGKALFPCVRVFSVG